ncbi:MAG: hypothetical protein ACXVPK_12115 [Tumebacillaceae bacterium]
MNTKIVYANLSLDDWYWMKPGETHAIKYSYAMRSPSDVIDSDTWYLVDTGKKAKRPLSNVTKAFTVVAASPQSAGEIRGWSEEQGFVPSMYTPLWSLDELQQCRIVVAPTPAEKMMEDNDAAWKTALVQAGNHPTADTVKTRFEKYGGIARVALANDATFAELQSDLERAFQECDLSKVVNHTSQDLRLLPGTSSWLLHYKVNTTTFDLDNIVFASKYILQRVWELHQTEKLDDMLRFINETSHNPKWRSASGDLFETYVAPSLLQQGGTFEVHKFTDPLTKVKAKKNHREAHAGQLVLPSAMKLGTLSLKSGADIGNLQEGQYGDQATGQLETIDGALRPSSGVKFIDRVRESKQKIEPLPKYSIIMLLFQFAVGDLHGVKVRGLLEAFHASVKASHPKKGTSAIVRFYFVVPPHQFTRFKVGTFEEGIDDNEETVGEADIPDGIEFWVLQAYRQATPSLTGTAHSRVTAETTSKKRQIEVNNIAGAVDVAACVDKGEESEKQARKKQKLEASRAENVKCRGICGKTFEGDEVKSMMHCTYCASSDRTKLFAVCADCKPLMVLNRSSIETGKSWFHPLSHQAYWERVD